MITTRKPVRLPIHQNDCRPAQLAGAFCETEAHPFRVLCARVFKPLGLLA